MPIIYIATAACGIKNCFIVCSSRILEDNALPPPIRLYIIIVVYIGTSCGLRSLSRGNNTYRSTRYAMRKFTRSLDICLTINRYSIGIPAFYVLYSRVRVLG